MLLFQLTMNPEESPPLLWDLSFLIRKKKRGETKEQLNQKCFVVPKHYGPSNMYGALTFCKALCEVSW